MTKIIDEFSSTEMKDLINHEDNKLCFYKFALQKQS